MLITARYFLITCLLTPLVSYSAESKHKMIFLRLSLVDGQVQLKSSRVVPGRAKIPRQAENQNHHGTLAYEVQNPDGKGVWQGFMKDPSYIHSEYRDPENPEQIKKDLIKENSISFVVRLPYNPDYFHINFFKIIPFKNSRLSKIPGKSLIGSFKISDEK